MDNYSTNHQIVDLWLDDLACNRLQNLLQDISLSNDEQQKASSFYFEKHQRHYRLAHQYLRWVLGQYLHCSPESIGFTKNAYGKPEIVDLQNNQHIQFNLSHSDSFIAVAIGKHYPLGVDVEVIQKNKEVDRLAAHCFSAQEFGQFLQLTHPQKNIEFYRHWSRKEAYVKALGTGLNTQPDSFSIRFQPLENPAVVTDNYDQEDLWKLWSIDALEKQGCTCALATQDVIVSVNSKSLLNIHPANNAFPYSAYGYS